MGFLAGKKVLIVGIASKLSIATGIADAMHREGKCRIAGIGFPRGPNSGRSSRSHDRPRGLFDVDSDTAGKGTEFMSQEMRLLNHCGVLSGNSRSTPCLHETFDPPMALIP